MFCENCGVKAREGDAFCIQCGAKLRNVANETQASANTAAAADGEKSDPKDDIIILQIIPSPSDPVTFEVSRLFLAALHHYAGEPLRVGLTGYGSSGEIHFAALLRREFVPKFREVVLAHFPNAAFNELPGLNAGPNAKLMLRRYKTENSVYRLNVVTDLQPDPYAPLVNAFATLKKGEAAFCVASFGRLDFMLENWHWAGNALAMIDDAKAENAPLKEGRMKGNVAEFEKKRTSELWVATVDISVCGSDETATALTAAFDQFAARFANARTRLIPAEPDADYLSSVQVMSTEELVGFVHVPHKSLQHPALVRATGDHKPAPEILLKEGVVVGVQKRHGEVQNVHLPAGERARHVYVIGKSGSGKSTLLSNLIRQDIESGSGVAVIDPHGDLCEELLNFIPETRVADAIYFNAADRSAPIALNVMAAEDDTEISLLTDDLIVTFRRLSDGWGQRMEHILGFVFQTLLRVPGTTLLDVRTILLNDKAREKMLRGITFPPILEFWRNEFPGYSKDALQPILSRMGKFSLSPTLYGILGQTESRLDFFDVIQNKKIFLANLSQGKIGTDTSQLVGSLLVSQFQLATMRRANLSKEAREPYYLYVDEFQSFTTSAFDKILSEARKYRLCLTMAHQYISQLGDDVRSSILNNTGTIIMFPLGPQDAAYLKSELGAFTPEDLTNLSFQDHEVLCRPPTKSGDTFKFRTLPPPTMPARTFAREVIEHTQENYSTVQRAKVATEHASPAPSVPADANVRAVPMPLPARESVTAGERILSYVKLAEYLSTQQIIELCYAHVAQSAQATAASRDLRQLVDAGSLKVQPFGRGNVYYCARTCNPTTHNLAVRDLLVKILRSGYDIAEVSFTLNLKTIQPDLHVSFASANGQMIRSLWEYDTGTEPTSEIVKKVTRYQAYPEYAPIVCVVREQSRMTQLRAALPDTPLSFAVMDDFGTLRDTAFYYGTDGPRPLFPETASAATSSL